MNEKDSTQTLDSFLESWEDTPQQTKAAFVRLQTYLAAKNGISFSFHARPSVSYSLRATHSRQRDKPLFVLIDVIDDDPHNRWLSVCFYLEMITDSAELGDLIPEGLLGEDGYCFDLEQWNDEVLTYLEAKLDEAYQFAAEATG